ncbi:hypothetical protein A9P82_14710 [Arachidicoccus ginsenosidimutans]|uniref:DUF6985 domain-containing protein n=1 Tax=Arachidicoccus sp. BS20 TaxID=1850526 RepID=UPI0007F0CFAE|nr:hypothetical protein [Arachidicoccus sp. BS20]ANI90427.1 hypothetical protein A9P82_14710 [Arachidicoccus sp. BS20]
MIDMISKIVGQLTQDKHFEECWNSELIDIPYFQNKQLKVVFTEAENESYFKLADIALENFMRLSTSDRENHSSKIVENYKQNLVFNYTPRLELKSDNEIWNFVYPTDIILAQNETGEVFVLVECGCEWEEEHGLQLVFKNGQQLTRVSYNDGGLEDE